MPEPTLETKTDTEEVLNGVATKRDVREAAASEKIITMLSSGVGALVSVLGIVAVLSGGSWFVIDRSEAASVKVVTPVAAALEKKADAADLELYKKIEAEHHLWTEQMLFRQDQKSDAILLGLGLRNPIPYAPPPPPPLESLLSKDAGR